MNFDKPWSMSEVPESPCPHCGHPLSKASTTGPHRPNPGDLSVAFCCATFLRFQPDLTVAVLTDREWIALPRETKRTLCTVASRIRDVLAGHHSV